MRLSRASIRELPREVFELTPSPGVIDAMIREAGRASFTLEDALAADIVQVAQLRVDETRDPKPACCYGCGGGLAENTSAPSSLPLAKV